MSYDPETRGETEPMAWTYRAVVETYDDRPSQCTIFPRETAGIDRMSMWITACGEGYVRLDEMR